MPLLHPGAPFPEQCSTLPTRATSLAAGPAAPASAIPAPPRLLSGDVTYSPDPLEPQPTARCSSAGPSPAPTSS
jgi:hypothetical protein